MGTIRLSALFPNPGNVLRPGQYGRVRAADRASRKQRAARAAARGDGAAERLPGARRRRRTTASTIRTVTLGQRVGNRWIVEKGLQAGDRVVVDAPSLKDGATVKPQPAGRAGGGALTCPASSSAGPIVAIVIAIVTVLGGAGRAERPADRAVPADRAAADHRHRRSIPGADALTIEQSVATPLEQQMNGVDDMLYMQSTNANDGTMTLTVTFDVDTDPEHRSGQRPEPHGAGAAEPAARGQPVRPDDAQADRPADADRRRCCSPNKSYDALFLANYANINILDALYRVPGVGEARIFGAGDYAMRIWVKPDLLARLGLTVPDVSRAIQQQSTVNPSGQVGANPAPAGQEMTYTVRVAGAAADARRSSARSPCARTPTARWSGCATSRASSSARSTTSRSAASTASPAARSPSSRRPARTRSTSPRACASRWRSCRARFPADLEYAYTLDTTLRRLGGHPRDRHHARRSDGAGRSSSSTCSCRTGARR